MAFGEFVKNLILPPNLLILAGGGGTFTTALTSGVLSATRSAAAGSPTVIGSFPNLSKTGQYSSKLIGVSLVYRATTADLSSVPTIAVTRQTNFNATTGATALITGTAVAVTPTVTPVVTASANDRRIDWNVDAPAFENTTGSPDDIAYNALITIPCAASTVLTVHAVEFRYTDLS